MPSNPIDEDRTELPVVPMTHEEGQAEVERLLGMGEPADDREALRRIGGLIDFGDVLRRVDAIEAALDSGTRLFARNPAPAIAALAHYYLSNAWEAKRTLTRSGWELHGWEQPELERQIVHLRLALRLAEEAEVPPWRVCQMYTNLGNVLSHCGRIVAAVAAWDEALAMNPDFGMALGNRGRGILQYGQLVHDPGHQILHIRAAYAGLSAAVSPGRSDVHPEARSAFGEVLSRITESVPAEALTGPPPEGDHFAGLSEQELSYRRWCLRERLFLNDLNDLGFDPVAAADVLTLPSLVTPFAASQPSVLGFFNQMKQEFASARFLYYEGITATEPHFSDAGVTMVNTLDYPAYGLAVEKVKIAFRIAYSLLDKVAYFLNDYLELGIPEKKVAFRSLWYDRQQPERGIRPDMHRPYDPALHGLFWLSKELYERDPAFAEAIEPDARAVAEIRNHLEHKYLKLHLVAPPGPPAAPAETRIGFEPLAFSLRREDFEQRTLWLLRTAREALINVSMAVYAEEAHRQSASDNRQTVPIHMDTWEDDWKF